MKLFPVIADLHGSVKPGYFLHSECLITYCKKSNLAVALGQSGNSCVRYSPRMVIHSLPRREDPSCYCQCMGEQKKSCDVDMQ
jgi:hypothetical protein